MRRLSLILAALLASACGTKGPLTLPPKNLPAAAAKAPAKPAKPAEPAVAPTAPATAVPADDSSKAAAESRQ